MKLLRHRLWYYYWYVKRPARNAAWWVAVRLPFVGGLYRLRFDLELEAILDSMSVRERVTHEGWKRKVMRVRA